MQVDDTQFPLVFLREHSSQQTPQQAQDQLEALLNRGQRFVLLTDRLGGGDHAHEESHEDRKQRALFFKQNKQRLKDLCAGMVVISKGGPFLLQHAWHSRPWAGCWACNSALSLMKAKPGLRPAVCWPVKLRAAWLPERGYSIKRGTTGRVMRPVFVCAKADSAGAGES
ncbi:hypothetical protein [Alcaligenes phenolicus]|uniref:hypothetical protein n=1 Tax=Alcaligenes phenolicus TaxID=232846 RepID=UPI002AA611ED|nr:hypothetical protein [Alcaligenes phenolicus]